MIADKKIPNFFKILTSKEQELKALHKEALETKEMSEVLKEILQKLQQTLSEQDLEVKLSTKPKNGKIYSHLIVQKKGAIDVFAELTDEEKEQARGLMNLLNIGPREAMMGLKFFKTINSESQIEDQNLLTEARQEVVNDQHEFNEIEKLKLQYLQMQLDAFFHPSSSTSKQYKEIENIISKVQSWKQNKKTEISENEKKILFEFLKGTYLQIFDENNILTLIPNEGLNENAAILKILFPDENHLTKDDLTNLGYDERKVANIDKIKDYNSFLETQKLLEKIVEAVNKEDRIQNFEVLSEKAYFDRVDADAQPNIVLKMGLQNFNQVAENELKIKDINPYNDNPDILCKSLETTDNKPLIKNNLYNSSLMLEEQHVYAMTNELLNNNETIVIKQLRVGSAATAVYGIEQQKATIQSAVINACKGKPVALQISDNSHWITLCLLPYTKDGVTTIQMVAMDSMGSCNLANKPVKEITALCKKLSIEGGIINVSESSINLTKELELGSSQQVGNCCGLATALNSASIMKTYMENSKEEFNLETFKENLLPNIFYGKKDGKNFILGHKETIMNSRNIVEQIGGLLLKASASEEALRGTSADVILVSIGNDTTDYLNKVALNKVLEAKQPIVNDLLAEVILKVNNKKYSFTYAEINELKKQTSVIKLLDSIVEKNGLLNQILSDERNKNLFAKYLRNEFHANKRENIKDFTAKFENVKYAVEFDEDLKSTLQEVVDLAKGRDAIDISTWDAFIMFVCKIPMLGTVLQWFTDNPNAKVIILANKLDSKIKSWENYVDISQNVGPILQEGFMQQQEISVA